MASRCYVYAIMRSATPLTGLANGDDLQLSTVAWRDLAAVISPVDAGTFRPTAERVLQHETVVEAVRQVGSALPVRFGTILPNEGAVAQALEEHHDVLLSDLQRLGDKVEMGLTVLWDPPLEPASTPAASSDTEHAEPLPAVQRAGTRYLLGRLAEYQRENAQRARAATMAQNLDDVLAPHALDRRLSILPAPRLAVRAVYLLDPPGIEAFSEAFERLRTRYPAERYLLSGPWPPYSFVSALGPDVKSTLGRLLRDAEGLLSMPARSARP